MQAISGLGDLTALQREAAVHVDSDMEAFTGMMKIVVTGIRDGVPCPMVAMVATQKSNTVVVMMVGTIVPYRYQQGGLLSSIAMVVAASESGECVPTSFT